MTSAVPYPTICLLMFQIIRVISALLGLAPCNIKTLPRSVLKAGFTFEFQYSQVGCACNIFLIAFRIGLTTIFIPKMKALEYPNDMAKTITLAIMTVENIAAITIITMYSVKQRDIVEIGNRVHDFDKQYGDKLIGRSATVLEDIKKSLKVSIFFVLWIALTITIDEITELIACGPSEALLSWSLIQYSLVISILKDRLEGLNNALAAIARYSAVLNFKQSQVVPETSSMYSDGLIINNLTMIRQAQNEIYSVSQQVSRFYSIPVLIVISVFCCSAVDSLYFYIANFLYLQRDDGALDCIFWTFIALYPIVVLSFGVHAFTVEANRTADIANDIRVTYALNKKIQAKLNIFAIELLHKRMTFEACGIFSLDCTLLLSIFGMTVTYLLILLQFNPSWLQ